MEALICPCLYRLMDDKLDLSFDSICVHLNLQVFLDVLKFGSFKFELISNLTNNWYLTNQ